jgi:competence protein ComEC
MKAVLVILGSFLIVVAIMFAQFINSSSSDFKMVFCDVGQGDSIYIRAFSQDIVVDGGPDDSAALECLSRHMPIFDRNIELMVVTHADGDHYAGFLDVLDSYTVTYFATSHGDSDVLGYQALLNKLKKEDVEVRRLTQGERIKINDELKIDVLWPPKEFTDIDSDRNNSSLVFLVDYNDFEAILTGDLDKEYLNLLLHDLSQIEIFKLSHHGSYTGTDDNTFESFRPKLSIISAGRNNRYGHPHKEVLEVLNRFDLKYISTKDGDIIIESDGKSFKSIQN